MFDNDEDGGKWIPSNSYFHGELTLQYAYKNEKEDELPWLLVSRL
jgi:hypothetical protein